MIPMFQAKEEELTLQHNKLKGLKQEIKGYMDEHGIRVKYVQPMLTTSFMNRRVPVPKKQTIGSEERAGATINNDSYED